MEAYYTELFAKVFGELLDAPGMMELYQQNKAAGKAYYQKRYNLAADEAANYEASPYALSGFLYTYQVRRNIYTISYNYVKKHLKDITPIPWEALMNEMVKGTFWMSEAFVKIVQEEAGKTITTPEALQLATGINAPVEAFDKALNEAGLDGYINLMEDKLRAGEHYPAIEAVDPADFNLRGEEWDTNYKLYTREMARGHAIALAFDLLTIEGNTNYRTLAKQIQAPYGVIMSASSLVDEMIADVKSVKEY